MHKLNKVLVFGATGAQGSPVVRQLLKKGIAVRAVSRNINKTKELFGSEVEAVATDLLDINSVRAAFKNVDAAFLLVPVSVGADGEKAFGNALQAAKEADLPRLVYTTGGSSFDQMPPITFVQILRGMSQAVLSSGVPSVVLRPTIYLENLLQPHVLSELRTRGTLSYPPLNANRKVSWTAQDDQATFAIAAMTTENAVGKVFDIVTPEAVTGTEIAELLSKKLKREIRYAPLSPAEFATGMAPFMGEPVSRMIAEVYEATDSLPADGAVIDLTPVLSILPVELTSVSEWIDKQDW